MKGEPKDQRRFRRNLRTLMERASVSQAGLARAAGVTPEYVRFILSGHKDPPAFKTAKVFCRLLAVSLETMYAENLDLCLKEWNPEQVFERVEKAQKDRQTT